MSTKRIATAFFIAAVLRALAIDQSSRAQVGPLPDPIPRPIPQSHIRVDIKPVVTGLTCPIYMTMSNGDPSRMFVVDQTGLIQVIKNGVVQQTPFLDVTGIEAQLSPAFGSGPMGLNPAYDERGLLGLAFHPGFNNDSSPGFHTLYTLHNVPISKRADFEEPPFPNAKRRSQLSRSDR